MEQVGLIILGAIVVTLSALAGNSWEGRQRRKREARVAARVIYGDLQVLEGLCETILKANAWPNRLDAKTIADGMVANWREQRVAFVGGVKAWEWALVDGIYSNLVRTVPEHEPGQACTDSDIASLEALLQRIPRAGRIVLERAAPKRQRAELVAQLTRDTPSTT